MREALNIPFNIMSAADPQDRCRAFVDANMTSSKPTHWFKDILSQVHNKPCMRHPYSTSCKACPESPDIGILGTPCHPYSTQRSNRWAEGSVEKHAEFDVSMKQFLAWLEKFEPKAQIFEQVKGFEKPFHTNTTETPLDRLRGCSSYKYIYSSTPVNVVCDFLQMIKAPK